MMVWKGLNLNHSRQPHHKSGQVFQVWSQRVLPERSLLLLFGKKSPFCQGYLADRMWTLRPRDTTQQYDQGLWIQPSFPRLEIGFGSKEQGELADTENILRANTGAHIREPCDGQGEASSYRNRNVC